MGQACSADELAPHGRRKLLHRTSAVLRPNIGARAGVRVADRCRDWSNSSFKGEPRAADTAAGAAWSHRDQSEAPRGLLGSGDEEDVQFLEALKGLVDGAVKLLGADKGVGTWIMSGLLRKSGIVDSFVDSMVVFVNQRIGKLMEALAPKDAACAFALRVRRHFEAHDATTAALGIRAGRRRSEADREGGRTGGEEEGEVEEHDVPVLVLWQAWKRSGGFWPLQLPDPDDPAFDGDGGTEEFISQLDDKTDEVLKDISKHLLQTLLPQDSEELRAACGVTASEMAGGGDRARGLGDARSIVDTANRLAQLKSVVLEPILSQVLTQQVIGRFCQSANLWQFMLQILRPSPELSEIGHDLKHPETFSLMAGALQRLDGTPTGRLKMDLMQGLVKMTWGSRDGPRSRGLAASRSARDIGGGGTPASTQQRQALPSDGSFRSRPRLESGESVAWSEVDIGSESSVGEEGLRSRGASSPRAATAGGKADGARDIFRLPYTEELSKGLAGGEKDKFYEDLEDRALEELGKYLQSEIVDKAPLARVFLPDTWVQDRVKAARDLARRPTNLMMVLSVLDAAKDVLRKAAEKRGGSTDKAYEKSAVRGARESGVSEGKSGTAAKGAEESTESKDGIATRPRRRAGTRRDTPGWRAWEARREIFFGADLRVAVSHIGRSLLGEEAVELGDAILKSTSFEYCSVDVIVRDQALNAMRRFSNVPAQELLVKVKPRFTQPILYVSSQMRMLRALKKTGLDFSKSFGDGPQKRALSRRFRSYSWIFTDELIDKLVRLKSREAARSRALASPTTVDSWSQGEEEHTKDTFVLVQGAGRGAHGGDARARELKREHIQFKVDVMREMTGFRSSKDLLLKIIGSWLPEVLTADMEGD